MTKIHQILTLDLSEDIKHVIDLEDRSEKEIKQEIESYIVTNGIAQHLYNFLLEYSSNIKETGVWISGFYGSGKSYFGKMLGYILDNPEILGTDARDRFIQRLVGLENQSLLENEIRGLETIKSRVVFLDVAKQNTDQGLAFTLFANFLRNLGFRDDVYGYLEFDLLIEGSYQDFKQRVKKIKGKEWDDLKQNNRLVAKTMREIHYDMDYSKVEYTDTLNVYQNAIENFSATKFKDELEKYLSFKSEETLVFIFDEASEAIGQDKFDLLELEGISEALSSISKKVWTIAIAQEKLNDVINNSNISRSQLTKVTDRFKTKIHLESTEVDLIIRSRLLQKKEAFIDDLKSFYRDNQGLVNNATNLKSSFPTKTSSEDDFAIYYPFHNYQFDVLQKFLFSSNALVTTQIAARGMIITTFDVLKKQMRDKELFDFTPGHAICSEAQPAPPVELVSKYDTARKILANNHFNIDGEQLLKTIHLLSESEVVSATVENITKSYIVDINDYFEIKPVTEKALDLLAESDVLLQSNNTYKITSDLEGKLLEEMNEYPVELFNKKRFLITFLRDNNFFNSVNTLVDGNDVFPFFIQSDQDDELSSAKSKQQKIIVYSLYNMSEKRRDLIEQVKMESQNKKDTIFLIPDNSDFAQIDKLIEDIIRNNFMVEKYAIESDEKKRQIVHEFGLIAAEKEKDLRGKINHAYKIASLVYLFDEYIITEDTFKSEINDVQRKLINNIYTKRLTDQLSEALIKKIFSNKKENLHTLFSGDEFTFFDRHGNFVGDHLKVVEEIRFKIEASYVDGKTLETELSGPPWGYDFGTIVTTLAVMFRAGRLSVKYDGQTWFSFEQAKVHEAFKNATRFRTASFKSVSQTLSAAQKQRAVQLLLDLEIEKHTEIKVDWNINDFELANAIRLMADHFIGTLSNLNDTIENFDTHFFEVANKKPTLQAFSGTITEGNYLEKVEYLLSNTEIFQEAIQEILKAQKFIRINYPKVNEYERFVEAVNAELKKADRSDVEISDSTKEFLRLHKLDMVNNFNIIREQAQIIKDRYFQMLKVAFQGMSHVYRRILNKVEKTFQDLENHYPSELNQPNLAKLNELKQYCEDRIVDEPELGFSITCKSTGYSLSDAINYTALATIKENEIPLIRSNFIREIPQEEYKHKPPLIINFHKIRSVKTIGEYKKLLTDQLSNLSGLEENREIKFEFDNKE